MYLKYLLTWCLLVSPAYADSFLQRFARNLKPHANPVYRAETLKPHANPAYRVDTLKPHANPAKLQIDPLPLWHIKLLSGVLVTASPCKMLSNRTIACLTATYPMDSYLSYSQELPND